MKIRAYGHSDLGRVREQNEDAWGELPDKHFYALADGMGGHQAGRIAAQQTVSSLCQIIDKQFVKRNLKTLQSDDIENLLSEAIRQVNRDVYGMGNADETLQGMGTTVCCCYFFDKQLVFAHVGDSRIYCLRRGYLVQLTKDHSLLRQMMDMGQLDEEGAQDFSFKNIITKAVGIDPDVEPSVNTVEVHLGDLFLLCSDGLTDLVSTEMIQKVLSQKNSLRDKGDHLIRLANEAGGKDNITVVLVETEA